MLRQQVVPQVNTVAFESPTFWSLVFVLGLHQKRGYVDLDKQDFPKINRNLDRIFVRHRKRSNIAIRPYYFDAAPGAPYPAECTYCFEIMWPRFNAMAGAITEDRWGACARLRDNVCGWTLLSNQEPPRYRISEVGNT